MTPALPELFEALEATWPAGAVVRQGSWCLRDGEGGGKRVSAATATGPVSEGEIAQAEAGMQAKGQKPLFMIRQGDAALDAQLEAVGYRVVDPTDILVCPVCRLTDVPTATGHGIHDLGTAGDHARNLGCRRHRS